VHQRIVRAKRKIEAAGIPYSVPTGDELTRRTDGVLRVVYLVFNEGHTATISEAAIRADLCAEAVRLARLLVELLPNNAECHGLLALLLLTDARRAGRVDPDGRLVALAEQDRTRWDHDAIDEGRRVLERAVALDRPGPYQLQAAIAAAHSCAPVADETDWVSVATLYQALERFDPSPVVRINRAVAIANADGPHAGMRLLDTLDAGELDGYVPFHAARADLARRLGDNVTAATEYARAIDASANDAESAALHERLQAITCKRPSGT
jgi:RNA polymerase sigma-70 factor (ECF subfamily)